MKIVILAGGFGTRISEFSEHIPKPMIKINNKPILIHIMNIYHKFGFNDFIIALGYKKEFIIKYFEKNKPLFKNFNIQLIDTGLNTLTGTRIKLLKNYLSNYEDFMLTYGDGLANIDINRLLNFHYKNNKIVTITAVRPPARFGELEIKKNLVTSFQEKVQLKKNWINGGFFVINKKFLDYIPNKQVMLEREPLTTAVKKGQLIAYKHNHFWYCMDNRRDYENLKKMAKLKKLPWNNYNKY